MKRLYFQILEIFLGLWIYGCTQTVPVIDDGVVRRLSRMFPNFFSVSQFMGVLKDEGVESASRYVNSALQVAPKNAALHFLNGFLYEEMERMGDKGKDALAGVAYKAAYGLDSSNAVGCYLYGSYKLKLGEYAEAQQFLTYAHMLDPKSVDTLYGLAYSSYYLKDLPVALSSIKAALKLNPNRPEIQRAAAIIFSACGQKKAAREALSCYKKFSNVSSYQYQKTKERVEQWENISELAQKESSKCTSIPKTDSSLESTEPESLFIDCYIVFMQNEKFTLQGNNFLEQLAVTVGDSSALAGFRRSLERETLTNATYPVSGSWEKSFAFSVTPISASYSLNIANAQHRCVDLVSRPTLTTIVGKTATFEDGLIYSASTEGSNGGAIINIPTGTNISITPRQITESDEVIMDVALGASTFSAAPDAEISISDQLVERTIGSTSSTAKVLIGQTIVIAGSNELATSSNETEMPGLGAIPIIQYFFKQRTVNQVRRNILYLITVRRSIEKKKKSTSLSTPSQAQNLLRRTGFWSLGEYTTLFYILQFLERSSMFSDFRSGDLAEPVNSFSIMSLEEKLSKLARFLYF
ncbi:type III secretion system outer membrane pore InvG [Holospora obtusa F1]|uniref:Type III secretion system outer membrane pore InvG n=1 Tax=Holospora obtusa F1 TaxID=1399147 RepID=W6TD13_HOLOB|nr:type III secretion system outer membrane pore InvG [Holospora obtusa]ETZ06753.1 type III secretion system outer membrane pore InvG [Holospora obtusa F1]